MANAVLMPKLGQTVEQAAIVRWHKKEGDAVAQGDVLFELETDKAVLEAESFCDGTLLKILVQEGVEVPVRTVVAYVGEEGEAVPDAPPPPRPAAPMPAAATPTGSTAASAPARGAAGAGPAANSSKARANNASAARIAVASS